MGKSAFHFLAAIALVSAAAPVPAFAADVDFGDDSSNFSEDGECDDMRFDGAGMINGPIATTATGIVKSGERRDALDYRRFTCAVFANQDRYRSLELDFKTVLEQRNAKRIRGGVFYALLVQPYAAQIGGR